MYSVSKRSKVPIAEDIGFSYSMAAILTFYWMKMSGFEALIYLNVLSIILSSILSYLKPVELVLYLFVKRFLHSSAVQDVLNSTFLDYTRSKIKAGFYLIILIGLLIVTGSFIDFRLLALALILIGIGMWYHDIRQLPIRVAAVLAYYGAVNSPVRDKDVLVSVRNALEAGNWKEAWQWLRFTRVSDVKIPEEILKKAWKLE